jgi:hypothetical protein
MLKSITKLLFSLMLVAIALGFPSRAHAGGGQYTCSTEFPQCYGPAEAALSNCANRCTESGGSSGGQTQVCYSILDISGEVYSNGSWYLIGDIDTTCDPVNYSGANCVQECLNVFTPIYQSCMNEYCTSN